MVSVFLLTIAAAANSTHGNDNSSYHSRVDQGIVALILVDYQLHSQSQQDKSDQEAADEASAVAGADIDRLRHQRLNIELLYLISCLLGATSG